jgi:hypothetical protein
VLDVRTWTPGRYQFYALASDNQASQSATDLLAPQGRFTILLPGDASGDGNVSFADLVAVAQNYGASNKTHAQGDLNGDGRVDFVDLVTVAQNYGKSLPVSAPPVPLPLPVASLAMVKKPKAIGSLFSGAPIARSGPRS